MRLTKKRAAVVVCALGALVLAGVLAIAGAFLYAATHQVQGDYFDSNGVRIHYTVQGTGSPVILIHGFCANSDINWRYPGVIKALAATHRVIAMDARGHGMSGKPHDPKAYGAEMAEDVVRLMDHLHLEKAHVAGYSMGGFITMRFVATHPDRLLNAAPCGAGWLQPQSEVGNLLTSIATDLRTTGRFDNLNQFLAPKGTRINAIRQAAENSLLRHINDIEALAACGEGFPGMAVTEEQLRANQVPVLFLIGEMDPLKRGVDEAATVMANQRQQIIAGGNHTTTVQKKQFVEALVAFFAD